MFWWMKTNHHAVHYAQRQQTLDSESERSCSHECSGEQAGETSVRHAGGTSGRTSDGPYRTKRLLTEHGPCVGAHRPLAGDAHGGHCHLDRGGGTWRTLPHLAATHIRQLVRRRALSGGGAQPSGQLVPAASQNDQAPPRYRAYLFGAVGGIAPDSGDLLARDSRPDQQPYQVHRRRSKRPRGGRRSTSRVSSSKTGWVLCTRRSAASSVIYRARCRIWQRVSSPLPQR